MRASGRRSASVHTRQVSRTRSCTSSDTGFAHHWLSVATRSTTGATIAGWTGTRRCSPDTVPRLLLDAARDAPVVFTGGSASTTTRRWSRPLRKLKGERMLRIVCDRCGDRTIGTVKRTPLGLLFVCKTTRSTASYPESGGSTGAEEKAKGREHHGPAPAPGRWHDDHRPHRPSDHPGPPRGQR